MCPGRRAIPGGAPAAGRPDHRRPAGTGQRPEDRPARRPARQTKTPAIARGRRTERQSARSVTGTSLFGKLAQHFLAGRDCFALPLGAGLLIVLTLLQLGQNPRLLTLPLEAAKRIL